MACGTPVLTTDVGGISDVVSDGETGFILPSNDPDCIKSKVIELLENQKRLQKVSYNACQGFQAKFSEESTLYAWTKIYQQFGMV